MVAAGGVVLQCLHARTLKIGKGCQNSGVSVVLIAGGVLS